MSLENFKIIADKIRANGCKIGAMFCWGEPLLDTTFFGKCRYAKSLDMFTNPIELNTNVSLLSPEMYDDILEFCPNLNLSFLSAYEDYERITGLSWENSYRRALDFIAYRDAHKPEFVIRIGCNQITGHGMNSVQRAFAGKNVLYETDAEILWKPAKVFRGPQARLIMHWNNWRCDGHSGIIQVIWNGDCECCAYDIVGTKEGCGETKFGNMLTDSWDALREQHHAVWRAGTSLCRRCDYWHHAKAIIANNGKIPNPQPEGWNDWENECELPLTNLDS